VVQVLGQGGQVDTFLFGLGDTNFQVLIFHGSILRGFPGCGIRITNILNSGCSYSEFMEPSVRKPVLGSLTACVILLTLCCNCHQVACHGRRERSGRCFPGRIYTESLFEDSPGCYAWGPGLGVQGSAEVEVVPITQSHMIGWFDMESEVTVAGSSVKAVFQALLERK